MSATGSIQGQSNVTFFQHPIKVAILGGTVATAFAIIGSLALSGLLLPHSSIGIFIIHTVTFKGALGLTIGGYSLSFIIISATILKICLRNRHQMNPAPAPQPNLLPLINSESNERFFKNYQIEFGEACDQNRRYRKTMEDETILGEKIGDNNLFFAVLDGHGGDTTVKALKNQFAEEMRQQIKNHPKDMRQAIGEAHKNLDARLTDKSGSCAVSVILTEDKIYFSNVGDTRVVISKNGQAVRKSKDHKAIDKDEQKRIEDRDGMIVSNKVFAQLAVTRAFGDQDLKGWVTAEPEIQEEQISDLENGDFIILACDGLWDVVEDQDAVDIIINKNPTDPKAMADDLLKVALEKGSTDNVSVVVIKIEK